MPLQVHLNIERNKDGLYEDLAKSIVEYAEEENLEPLDIAYEFIEQYKHKIGEREYEIYEELVKHELLEEFKRLCDDSGAVDEYKAGKVFLLRDAGETYNNIRQKLYREVEELVE